MARAAKKNLTAADLLGMSPAESRRVKLEEIRASRLAAEAKGVYTCVPGLHRQEMMILAEQAASGAGASDVSTMSTDDLVDVLVAVVPDLTEAAAQKLQAALSARPPHLRIASGV